jgi:ferredoxin
MADAANKYPENVPGKYYVDEQCIDCDLCRETAPANFKRNDDGGHSTFTSKPNRQKKKRFAKKQWKVARSKRSATTAPKIDIFCSGGLFVTL